MSKLLFTCPMPHGGKLVDRVIKDKKRARKMIKGCPSYEIKPTLHYKKKIPVRNVYREIMSICYGFFSPVEGSMSQKEVERILKERRLLSNWLFPFPLVFDISKEEYKRLKVSPGDRLLLTLKKKPFAILDIEEIWEIEDLEQLAHKTFGTPEDNSEIVQQPFDENHPGWVIYRSLNPIVLAGKYTIINEPKFKKPFDRFWFPPKKAREEFQKRGWRTVICHQTRNVPHVGHEFLMKCAAFTGDIEPCHGILVNAVIGVKRLGDYPDEAIVEGQEALTKGGYIKKERHLTSFVLWDMRYGGALEALLHGIIRQNMGCTHHMFGRDHASVGKYYNKWATQILWLKGLPSYGLNAPPTDLPYGLEIRPQTLREFYYCPICKEMAYSETCAHPRESVSGTSLREIIIKGEIPADTVMRPEVYQIIKKWWDKFGHPFCTEEYIQRKEEHLEIDLEDL